MDGGAAVAGMSRSADDGHIVVVQASPFSPSRPLSPRSPKFEIEHRGALGVSEIENVSTVSEECSNYTIDLRSCCYVVPSICQSTERSRSLQLYSDVKQRASGQWD